MRALSFMAALVLALFAFASPARAETWQIPVGARAISLGDARVACPGVPGEWTFDAEGRSVRAPAGDDAIGKVSIVQTAANAAACGAATSPLTLVAIGRWPALDATSVTLAVDDARVELRGRGLRGMIVHWQAGARAGEDRCVQPQQEAGSEKCAFAIGRGLAAEPTATGLRWLPAGARQGADVVTFDANGRRVTADEFALHPARVVIASVLPSDATIDLAGGTASRIPLTHPEAVTSAECGAGNCEVTGGAVVVHGVSNLGAALAVRLRLLPKVYLQRGDVFDPAPTVQIAVLPCGMAIASGDVVRGVDDSRVVVRVDARCSGEAKSLRFFAAGRAADTLAVHVASGDAFVLLRVGKVDGEELAITASRGGSDAAVVGAARARTRSLATPRASLELPGGAAIDFIPTNRPALVRFGKPSATGRLALLPLEGVYGVDTTASETYVVGERGAAGFVALRFAYRVPSLPGELAHADLAVVVDPVERPIREASVPVPLGASLAGPRPLIELLCTTPSNPTSAVKPGAVEHIPFGARDGCRLVFHRERLAAEDGAQHLHLEIDVARADGALRPEAHVSQSVVMRPSAESGYAWIKGVTGPFDRISVRVAHAGEEWRDLTGGPASSNAMAPAAQWAVIAGTGRARLYATTSIPTGLYRVSDSDHSGILTLNFGVIARLTWLDSEGQAGFLGLEAGMMGMGLANDLSSTGKSLTQVATVTGIGLSVPIANRSLATETAINLHAWVEYEVSRDLGNQKGSPLGFVFGPSISIGNIGTNL